MLDEKGQPLHECGMAYMDRHSDNMAQRDYLETSLRAKKPKGNGEEVVVKQLQRGEWRAYFADYVSTYCQRQGGSVHVRLYVMYHHNGGIVQGPSLAWLLHSMLALPFLEVTHPSGLTHKRMLAAVAANRY
jgi:hypothetical protein